MKYKSPKSYWKAYKQAEQVTDEKLVRALQDIVRNATEVSSPGMRILLSALHRSIRERNSELLVLMLVEHFSDDEIKEFRTHGADEDDIGK